MKKFVEVHITSRCQSQDSNTGNMATELLLNPMTLCCHLIFILEATNLGEVHVLASFVSKGGTATQDDLIKSVHSSGPRVRTVKT